MNVESCFYILFFVLVFYYSVSMSCVYHYHRKKKKKIAVEVIRGIYRMDTFFCMSYEMSLTKVTVLH